MISKIHFNINWVLGIKNFVEIESELGMRELKFKFLNRSVLLFPVHKEIVKAKERKVLKVEAPFLGKVTGLGRIKLLGLDTYGTLTMKVKCDRNKTF